MTSATEQLIDLVERLTPSGTIGDGMVARLQELAGRSRAELETLAGNFGADSNLSRRICCDGQMCGCHGATAADYVEYRFRESFGLPRK